jgi:hypothetical protein
MERGHQKSGKDEAVCGLRIVKCDGEEIIDFSEEWVWANSGD